MGDSGPVTGGLPPAVRLLRPRQWVKNVFVLAALVFAGRLTDHAAVIVSLRLLLGFCLLSSALYIINDLRDAEDDRRHPAKRDRPLAINHIQACVRVPRGRQSSHQHHAASLRPPANLEHHRQAADQLYGLEQTLRLAYHGRAWHRNVVIVQELHA